MKAKGQEAVDDLLKNTSRSDLFSSFNKTETNTIQWLHWLDILDQQTNNQGFGGSILDSDLDYKGNKQQESLRVESKTDLPGWPLMSNKMQMHKCEKCSLEFCSPLNQRRHMRATHRRPLNGDKEDLKKKREQIAAFWDKLNSDDACEIVSAKNLSLMDLSAMSIIRALTAQLQQPSLLLLPQTYIKVATALMDLVQSKNLKAPPKSGELFAILEDASEKNMLCGVTSSSMHRCIFDSDPERVGLETKNLAASLGFLIEYRLVRAWMDDKDAEALRCQKELVEEEEAAQKRRAKLLERKKQRKLRQKEFKDKERRSIESSASLQELKFDAFPREGEDSLTATQSSPSSSASSGLELHTMESPQMANGDCEDGKFSTSCPEVGQSYGGAEDVEENCSAFSNHASLQKSLNESVEERDVVPSTGFSMNGGGWKERRQADGSYFPNNGRQFFGKDRKHYDHQYGGQRLVRTPYGVSSFEYFTPRYGHYREKLPALKRPSAIAGTGHAVWARKTPQTPLAVSQHIENVEMSVSEGRDDFTRARLVMQSEQLDTDDQSCLVKSEKGLSRASSLSSDSATSQSSVSISARVGAEEQETSENKLVAVSLPRQITSVEGELAGSAALVIGSVTIPLEQPLPGSTVNGPLNEDNSTLDVKSELKSTVLNGPCFNPVIHEGPGFSQFPCTQSVDGSFTPRSAVTPGVREEGTVQSRFLGSTVQNKPVVKVWRPVTPGERSGPHAAVPSSSEAGAADSFTQHRREAGAYSLHDSLSGTGGDLAILSREQTVFEGIGISLSGDVQQPPDPSLTMYYSELASFLAQRWVKAVSSPDIVCHNELDDPESGESM